MSTQKPLKRHAALIPFSREHHHSLLLGWKIKTGFSKNVEIERMKKYTDWFFKNHVLEHFEEEEKYIFPILGNQHPLVKKALADHERLTQLFNEEKDIEESLKGIQKELEAHIRFEERQLFKAIQEDASPEELQKIEEIHDEIKFEDNTTDQFWL